MVDGLGKIGGRWAVIIGFDNKVAGRRLGAGAVREHPARHQPRQAAEHPAGLAGQLQRRASCPSRRSSTPTAAAAAPASSVTPNSSRPAFRCSPASTAPTPRAAATRASARPSCSRTRTPTSPSAASASSPAWRRSGGFDVEGLEELIARTRDIKERPPGRAETHYGETGFFAHVYDEEKGVLDGIKEYMRAIPAYDPKFFRVARACRAAAPRRRPVPPAALQPEGDVLVRRHPRPPRRWQRAHGVPARLRPRDLHRTGEGRRPAAGRDRQPTGAAAQGLSRVRRLSGHRRQAVPPGPDQDERVRDPVRTRPGADRLVPGHHGHRRRRPGREGRAAGPRAVARSTRSSRPTCR